MELHYIRKHANLIVLFGQHSGTGLLALRHARHITDSRDSKEIQEIQRIKNIITNTSLKKMGQMQVDVRQRPVYKAVVL
jgi:inner membrane protein involved in colicin E2 resistance